MRRAGHAPANVSTIEKKEDDPERQYEKLSMPGASSSSREPCSDTMTPGSKVDRSTPDTSAQCLHTYTLPPPAKMAFISSDNGSRPSSRPYYRRRMLSSSSSRSDSYRIVKQEVSVQVALRGAEPEELTVFLHSRAALHPGAERPSELLSVAS